MSSRIWLAFTPIVVFAVGLLCPHARAADEAAPTKSAAVFAGLVPDDAFAAIVVSPKSILANEALAKFDVKGMAEDLAKQLGLSPMDVEQAIILMGPPAGPHMPPMGAGILRISKPVDQAELAAKLVKPGRTSKPEEAEMAGHKYFRLPKSPNGKPRDDDMAICFIDEQTFITCDIAWLPKILAAKDAKSMLISALTTNDPAADATIIFTNTDAAKELIAGAMPKQKLAGPLKPLGDLPDLLRAAKLNIRTTPEVSLKLTLLGNDEASAGKLADMIKMAQQMGHAFLPALQAQGGANVPAEQRESSELLIGLAKKLIDGLVPQQDRQKVTVEIDNLGTIDSLVGKLVLPAVIAARGAAQRTAGMNNLRQLALAMIIAQSTDGQFPAHAIYSKDGKPLLSWRVYALPDLDQKPLFDQFHLDEPWDSANNKPLIAKMPAVFKSPTGKPLAVGQTRYVVPVGKDTIFDGAKRTPISQITDGLSNTILILEVGEDKAVTWTKPDDMDFDPQKPLAGVGTIGDSGIPAAFADGHVQSLRKSVDAESFRRLILRNDQQPIDPGKL